jgi:hypothetical protein
VARRFLTEVHQGHKVEFDNLTNGTGVLIGKCGVMTHPGIVDEKVDATRQCNGLAP